MGEVTRVPPSPPADAPVFSVGAVILGRYEVTALLGAGGMSRVYAADDRWMGRPVALRVPIGRPTADALARFETEARIMLRLSGPSFAAVYDLVSTDDGIPIMVMERLVGEDLSACLRRRGPFPRREAIDLTLQACEVVAQAHAVGVVHLDLKPSNFFLAAAPAGPPLLKVLDFGLSRLLEEEPAPWRSIGTPGYAAPEQLEGPTPTDARADVWSLGVVLYQLLTGALPFGGATTAEMRSAVAAGSYRQVSTYSGDIPSTLERALAGALSVEPWMRVPSIESFAESLWPFGTSEAKASSDRVRQIAARPRMASTEPPRDAAPLFRKEARLPSRERSPRVLRGRWRPVAAAALAFGLGAADYAGVVHFRAVSAPFPWPELLATTEQKCKFGFGDACAELAVREDRGDPGSAEDLSALAHYRHACTLGYLPGCLAYERRLMRGTCMGLGMPLRKETDAVMIASEICDDGDGEGCVDASRACEYGRGMPADPELSFEFAKRACEAGALEGCARMARARLDGDGVAQDAARARAELRTACDLGGFAACEEIAALDPMGLPTRSEQALWPEAPECPPPGWQSGDIAKNIGQ